VEAWLDEAVELLPRMRYTCALDVVDELGAITDALSAELLGLTKQALGQRVARYLVRLRLGLAAQGVDVDEAL